MRLLVAPASLRDQKQRKKTARCRSCWMPAPSSSANACGICAGYGGNLLAENMVAISSTARNFKGRMGAASSQVYLASPYTVAATAVAGRVSRPAGDAAVRAWVLGDNVDTDVIAPGRYMKFGIEEIAQHCLEAGSARIRNTQ